MKERLKEIEQEMIRNKRAFCLFNKKRLERALEMLPEMTGLAFQVIPFLIHTNHKGFPGYVDARDTPCGIHYFEWSNNLQRITREFFPEKKILYKGAIKLFPNIPSIESLLLMGSIGTVAQTERSDFDYWVCINEENFSDKRKKLLREKLRLIEDWGSSEYEMEIHFFMADINKVRRDDFGESDSESVGSAQKKLLKEEFYRTLILIAGKIPLWWITPIDISDEEYSECIDILKKSVELEYENFIDLGNIRDLSPNEFLGATLWHRIKAMDSPYKSTLKMALVEKFMDQDVQSEPLCNLFKKSVMKSPDNSQTIDPYTIMFDTILDYYQKKGNMEILDLLKKSFYIKTDIKVNRSDRFRKDLTYKEKVLVDYVKKWGWDQEVLEDLNSFKEWDFDKIISLERDMHNYMIQVYKNLADKLKKESGGENLIKDTDFQMLGRKLSSFYAKKPNKVESLKKAFWEKLPQENLTFLFNNKRAKWYLYRGHSSKEFILTSGDQHLKSAKNILELLIWIVHNRLCDENTTFYLTPNPKPITFADIQILIKDLLDFFPAINTIDLKTSDLLAPPRIVKLYLVINFSLQKSLNQIKEVTIFYTTTWGELFCETYNHMKGIKEAIKYISENPPENINDISNYYRIFIPKGDFSKTIFSNINNLITKELGSMDEGLYNNTYFE